MTTSGRHPRNLDPGGHHDDAGSDDADDDRTVVLSRPELGETVAPAVLAEIDAAARSRRVPVVMAAVTAGAGAGAWGCVQIAGAFGGDHVAAVAGAAVWAGTAVAVPTLRAVFRQSIPDRWTRTWWTATSCAALWVDAVAVSGPALLDPTHAAGYVSVLLLGAAALGARWADEHEVPNPGDGDHDELDAETPHPPPAPPPPVVDDSEARIIEQDWDERVAHGQNPIAADSALTDRHALPHGYRWLVLLDRDGSVGCTELEADGMSGRVALKLGKRPTHVMLERLDGDDDREDRAWLTVVTRDALAGGVPYLGPRYDHGVIPIGAYADGTGTAPWLTYNDTGVLCGLITGGQGSGKSVLMAALGMGYRSSGEWIVLFGDGDEQGGSSRLLGEVAHDFARGPAEVLEQLEGLEALGRSRGVEMGTLTAGRDGRPTPITAAGQRPVDKILPCPRFPGVVWIIDEFHRLANDPELKRVGFVDRVEKVVRILRKYGGAVVVGTQSALGDDFDGNSALRAMLASGNAVALRSKNKSEQGIVTDGFDPGQLPKGGGYAFLGEGDRRAMIRAEFSPDMQRWLPEVVSCGTPDQRSWAAFRRYRQVRELDLAADYAEKMAELAAFDAAVETGAPLPGSPEARQAGDVDRDGVEALSVGGFAIPVLSGNVVPIRPDVAVPAPQVDETLPVKARQVLDALQSRPGSWRTGDLATTTGLSTPDVSKALRVLVDRDLVHRPTGMRGVYAPGPEPTDRRGVV